MSAVGHCTDNASAESFFGQMKRERIKSSTVPDFAIS